MSQEHPSDYSSEEVHLPDTPENRRPHPRVVKVLKRIMLWGMLASPLGLADIPGMVTPSNSESEKTRAESPELTNEVKQDNFQYLQSLYGQKYLRDMLPGPDYARDEKKYGGQPTELHLNDRWLRQPGEWPREFNVSPGELRTIFRETFPARLVDTEVNVLVLTPGKISRSDKKYGHHGFSDGQTISQRSYGNRVESYRESLPEIIENIAHELGHTMDWKHDVVRSVAERLDLWRTVTERYLLGENKIDSQNAATVENDDATEDLYLRVSEYWADACREYLLRPGWLQQHHPEDFAMVHVWVKRGGDETYDPFAAATRRQGILAEKSFRESLHSLPPGVQQDIGNIRQELLARHLQSGGEVATGNLQWPKEYINSIEKVFRNHNIPEDSRLIQNIRMALETSIDYRTNRDYQP